MRLLPLLLAIPLLLLGCGEDDTGAGARGDLTVVATTTQAAELARHVAGPEAEVVGLLPANADPHAYEVRPRDVQALADADLIVRSGGDLDEWLQEAIEGAGADAPVVTLLDAVHTIEGGHGHEGEQEHDEHAGGEEEHAGKEDEHAGEDGEVDPHWWHDVRNGVRAVGAIRDALVAADPERAPAYRANADAYTEALRALDREIAACIGDIPAERRKLVTTHDALGYYADRYGLEVIGAVIPSLSTAGQPSAGETAELVATIRDERVPAIFTESSVNASVEQAIAREAGARVGAPLQTDSLAPETSYAESMRTNTERIAEGLGAPCS